MVMAAERLSRLQHRILTWLAADHQALVRALVVLGFDKGNVSTSLKGLEAKGLITITRTPSGRAEAVDLTRVGRNRVAPLTESCE
jgi:DNA-binding MarR family transcriptional regulator